MGWIQEEKLVRCGMDTGGKGKLFGYVKDTVSAYLRTYTLHSYSLTVSAYLRTYTLPTYSHTVSLDTRTYRYPFTVLLYQPIPGHMPYPPITVL